MGTRYLTVIVDGEREPIAQIGLFDGHPLSSGTEILKTLLRDRDLLIKEQLHRCVSISDAEYRSFCCRNSLDEEALEKAHPNFWWSDGAELLEELLDGERNIEFHSAYEFAYDSLMCEWAYVIDYSANTFEIYQGFNKEPLTKSDRFYHDGYRSGEYYPVKRIAAYELTSLPSVRDFRKKYEHD